MNRDRALRHVIFWLCQYGLSLYNELYLSASFSQQPAVGLFLQCALSVLILTGIKMAATYFILYRLIPLWIASQKHISGSLQAFAVIIAAAACMRLAMYKVVWPLIYGEPSPAMSALQFAARYFYSMLDLLQVAGMAVAIKLLRLRVSAVQNEKILVQEKLRSEMLYLKSQVNPHFLFNTINGIYTLARSRSSLAAEAIMRLSHILRYMLYDTGRQLISLGHEIQVIEDFIELQRMRFGSKLCVRFEKSVDDSSVGIAPLLLMPLVENAFKHGGNTGNINIKVDLKDNQFVLRVSNPLNMAPAEDGNEEGIGLLNVKRQLELLYRDYSFDARRAGAEFITELKFNTGQYAGFELFDSRG